MAAVKSVAREQVYLAIWSPVVNGGNLRSRSLIGENSARVGRLQPEDPRRLDCQVKRRSAPLFLSQRDSR